MIICLYLCLYGYICVKHYKTLLIDDDVEFCRLLTEYLGGEGFDVTSAHDGQAGSDLAITNAFDIVILDVMLPVLNGFDALKQIKQKTTVPVLMLTAKGGEVDQVVGLEIGADDYLPKPCSPRLLVARLKAILRRIPERVENNNDSEILFVADDITIHHDKRTILKEGMPLELTQSEYNILLCLVKNKSKVVTKEELCEQGLNRKIEAFDRSIDMHISHVRNKIGMMSDGSPRIKTIRGVGYRLDELA